MMTVELADIGRRPDEVAGSDARLLSITGAGEGMAAFEQKPTQESRHG